MNEAEKLRKETTHLLEQVWLLAQQVTLGELRTLIVVLRILVAERQREDKEKTP